MNFLPFDPPPELRDRLDKAAPTVRDFVLFCPECGFVGETNAAYAASFMAKHKLRIWRGAGR
jgi:hypothetical protein